MEFYSHSGIKGGVPTLVITLKPDLQMLRHVPYSLYFRTIQMTDKQRGQSIGIENAGNFVRKIALERLWTGIVECGICTCKLRIGNLKE